MLLEGKQRPSVLSEFWFRRFSPQYLFGLVSNLSFAKISGAHFEICPLAFYHQQTIRSGNRLANDLHANTHCPYLCILENTTKAIWKAKTRGGMDAWFVKDQRSMALWLKVTQIIYNINAMSNCITTAHNHCYCLRLNFSNKYGLITGLSCRKLSPSLLICPDGHTILNPAHLTNQCIPVPTQEKG